jgi:tRNA threonylcarbamoyladenosine biosynthesis protein TsaB
MLILGIESATKQVGCAIGGHEGVLASTHSARARRHAESLAPQIQFTLSQARIEIDEVSVVAVDIGPGLFTGLRVGITSALAIAFGLSVPMIGVSSLDLVAFPVRHTRRLVVAVIDARRGELFTAFYRQVPGGLQRVTEPQVMTPNDLYGDLQAASTECLLVGDGALRYRERFSKMTKIEVADESLAYPSASSLVTLAHARALREDFVQPGEISPLYLRRPDAEVNWQTRPVA